ncbi:hypothetical protein [Shewanella surugensis]|uniref:Uncharacterized protein n=1 Tax=Shewanella surugensis TaxID=212020 RepID=A0ABT0LK92_9GAMM|nr:hypothetical protein [Shewanella surugensis]MCL1127707.1 hypothetical protein [Shewanella surugensis]
MKRRGLPSTLGQKGIDSKQYPYLKASSISLFLTQRGDYVTLALLDHLCRPRRSKALHD